MTRHINWEFIESNTGDYIRDIESNEKIFDVIQEDNYYTVIPHRLFAEPIHVNCMSDIQTISIIDGITHVSYINDSSTSIQYIDITPITH